MLTASGAIRLAKLSSGGAEPSTGSKYKGAATCEESATADSPWEVTSIKMVAAKRCRIPAREDRG
jgi:hypothetical protein